ncbi:FAD-linked oxidase C-terminal domain-containing protein [Inhella gelatinilytica]|uniref:FAD-binding protein n=1 Tax=Inhella gelatinilytica TaxID=2795030 RepID=A0A931NC64_9BURK|nr:FAD-linked oxidase C-terminal domain-containing protein [Inhella gelatinilytica]MBH9551657.1 FAD-binding protein [Inhella gelatinilytica]
MTEREARRQALWQRLGPVLGAEGWVAREGGFGPYEADGFTAVRQRPLAVAIPRDAEQVAAVLRACHEQGVPIVARGAGTGLSGGATPHPDGLTLSLARLNQILEIDPLARTARVQCGVRNLAISQAAAAHGLYYAPDPSSQIACTIGGNVAENAGGVHCLKYGLTLHNVLGVRGFTVEGEPLELGSMSGALESAGPDWLALAVGSEGLLCVVTEVLVRLTPKPPVARCLLASFADVSQAGQAVAALMAGAITPAGLELMDGPMTAAVEDYVHAGYDLSAAALLLCESDGDAQTVEAEIALMRATLQASGATRIDESRTEAERLRFWSGRKNAFPASGRISPDYLCMDASIPRSQLAPMLQRITAMQSEWGLRCFNVFHAGDGNLHPLILFDAKDPEQLRRAEGFGAAILAHAVALGGSITGEHGVGLEKLDSMCTQFSADELAAFHALKAAWDPAGLLNPGKAIPQLRRCAEGGALWVRNGQLPHPELERF